MTSDFLRRSGEVQDIKEVELPRCCSAGGIEGTIAEMIGFFWGSGEED